MTVYILKPDNALLDSWFFVTQWSVETNNSTSILLLNADGTYTQINGTGFTFDALNEPLSGQITSMTHLDADGVSVLEKMVGLHLPLTDLRATYEDYFALDPTFVQTALAGNDVVIGSDNLPPFFNTFEFLFTGAGNDIAFGRAGNNVYPDSIGNDVYVGWNHSPNVALFFDLVDFSASADPLNINLTGGHGSHKSTVVHVGSGETDTLVNIDDIYGSDNGDRYVVDQSFVNHAGDGINTFSPGAGDDVIIGNGHTFLLYGRSTSMTIDLDAGTAHATNPADAPFRGVDTLSGVNAIGGSLAKDFLYGSNGPQAELFEFTRGQDVIDGRGGDHDRFEFFRSHTDRIVDLSAPEGKFYNAVTGSVDATLFNIEDIDSGTGNDSITMNAANNLVFGNAGNDEIRGLDGDDVLYGDFGVDPYGLPHFFPPGVPGWDQESVPGNDILIGGMGRDVLTGGGGQDRFEFDNVLESGKTAETRDVITDFTQGDDLIDVTLIDANILITGDQAFSFIGEQSFSGNAGELRFISEKHGHDGITVIAGDINGDKIADFQIELTGTHKLTAADFLL